MAFAWCASNKFMSAHRRMRLRCSGVHSPHAKVAAHQNIRRIQIAHEWRVTFAFLQKLTFSDFMWSLLLVFNAQLPHLNLFILKFNI